jgi:hypothetical protein
MDDEAGTWYRIGVPHRFLIAIEFDRRLWRG